jgi:hypothetical protein
MRMGGFQLFLVVTTISWVRDEYDRSPENGHNGVVVRAVACFTRP